MRMKNIYISSWGASYNLEFIDAISTVKTDKENLTSYYIEIFIRGAIYKSANKNERIVEKRREELQKAWIEYNESFIRTVQNAIHPVQP
jgi:hypothetical protein